MRARVMPQPGEELPNSDGWLDKAERVEAEAACLDSPHHGLAGLRHRGAPGLEMACRRLITASPKLRHSSPGVAVAEVVLDEAQVVALVGQCEAAGMA